MTKVRATGLIDYRLNRNLVLATVAEVDDEGLFSLRARSINGWRGVEHWRGTQTPIGLVRASREQVTATFPQKAAAVGKLAIKLMRQYLEEAQLPHEVVHEEGRGWSTVILCPELPTVCINAAPDGVPRSYVYVTAPEYVGSALYSIFQVLGHDAVDPSQLLMRQFHGNDPQPFSDVAAQTH